MARSSPEFGSSRRSSALRSSSSPMEPLRPRTAIERPKRPEGVPSPTRNPSGDSGVRNVASPMVSMLDLERFRATPLTREPFEFLIVPEFVKTDARSAIHNDYPEVNRPGSFPLAEVSYGPAFARLVEEMRSEQFRKAFEEKFAIDLTNRPDMITV